MNFLKNFSNVFCCCFGKLEEEDLLNENRPKEPTEEKSGKCISPLIFSFPEKNNEEEKVSLF